MYFLIYLFPASDSLPIRITLRTNMNKCETRFMIRVLKLQGKPQNICKNKTVSLTAKTGIGLLQTIKYYFMDLIQTVFFHI